MHRTCMTFLQEWLRSSERRPLVIRGARQVGKTWIVQELARISQRILIELNFEGNLGFTSFFQSNDPEQIMLNLSSFFNMPVDSTTHMLFLDEIQAAPELLAKLRWFAEKMPELPVVAAGSLLEFVLAKHTFSMPVGRIDYMYLEPLSFEEFLYAMNKEKLVQFIKMYSWDIPIPQVIHDQIMSLFREYVIIGGMPRTVSRWTANRSLQEISKIQNSLLATYREDFAKYSGALATERIDETMMAIPRLLGKKIVYSKINPAENARAIKQALSLLCKARICHQVHATSANGVPLAAEVHSKYFKAIFLDMGLCSASLGLSLDELNSIEEITLINQGGMAEQIVGQVLRTISSCYTEPNLYYWTRMEPGSEAEVDYVIQHRSKVIPLEVKASSSGSLKSLHLFMELKELPIAIRVYSGMPSRTAVATKGLKKEQVNYTLLSVPFYLISELHRLLDYNKT